MIKSIQKDKTLHTIIVKVTSLITRGNHLFTNYVEQPVYKMYKSKEVMIKNRV